MSSEMYQVSFELAGRHIATASHTHATLTPSMMELIYVQRGTLYLYENERSFQIMPHERVFLFSNRTRGGLAPYRKGLSFFWMYFRTPDESRYAAEPRQAVIAAPDFFNEYVRMLLSEQRRYRQDSSPETAAQLNALAGIILRESCRYAEGGTVGRANTLIDFAKQYIDSHFMTKCETADIADQLECHKDYLSRLYSQTCGETIGDSVRKKRIDHACSLLENTSATTKQIAFASGYNDLAYFRRQFFRECAMTPNAYRLMHRYGFINE